MRAVLLAALLIASPAIVLAESIAPPAPKPLVVHEWGTFTSLQDENGSPIAGLNSNDEPLPQFVHRLGGARVANDNDPAYLWSKSVARMHPDVTMRLETPVIYFHPADDTPLKLDVSVKFNAGILSEFYPGAITRTTIADKPTTRPAERITSETVGTLTWKNVIVAPGEVKLPETKEHVWLAPRAVNSAPITVGKESEQYIFYRGLGHLDAPIRVVRRSSGNIVLYDQRPKFYDRQQMKLGGMWLAEFNDAGECAFRAIAEAPANGKVKALEHAGTFAPEEFSKDNLANLRSAMHEALVKDGLFADEADAMLETWKLSYFKSTGQRLFFLVPHEWTDEVLPLQISKPCELTRVMVGRIELITPQQREHIQFLTRLSPDNPLLGEEKQKLGRFADALILDEMKRNPSEPLRSLCVTLQLIPKPVAAPAKTS